MARSFTEKMCCHLYYKHICEEASFYWSKSTESHWTNRLYKMDQRTWLANLQFIMFQVAAFMTDNGRTVGDHYLQVLNRKCDVQDKICKNMLHD